MIRELLSGFDSYGETDSLEFFFLVLLGDSWSLLS